ncbi:hypothetical protein E2C01_011509 [Portunus trituberculatus]|uniref:Uncharacterized protein n=1 Tax=Portunus trituberculatus TaxID=210409 RepID=A0A5B7DBE5_PORTR|nr:hypothetical protein [Portunus trituberculatus]
MNIKSYHPIACREPRRHDMSGRKYWRMDGPQRRFFSLSTPPLLYSHVLPSHCHSLLPSPLPATIGQTGRDFTFR